MQQPDKLFQDKLEHFQLPVPGGAWDRIETHLEKKTRGMFWVKIAAGITLPLIGGLVIWMSQPTAEYVIAARPSAPTIVQPKKDVGNLSAREGANSQQVRSSNTAALIQMKRVHNGKTDTSIQLSDTGDISTHDRLNRANDSLRLIAPLQPILAQIPLDSSETDKKFAAITVTTIDSNTSRSNTIVYSVAATDQYLVENNLDNDATAEEEKPSTFRKLLNKAYGLKNNQDPFGELRQKKNEILALNFKKDKRGQKK